MWVTCFRRDVCERAARGKSRSFLFDLNRFILKWLEQQRLFLLLLLQLLRQQFIPLVLLLHFHVQSVALVYLPVPMSGYRLLRFDGDAVLGVFID